MFARSHCGHLARPLRRAAALGTASGLFLLLRRKLVVVTISGTSMEPTLRTGDHVLGLRTSPRRLLLGDIIIVRPPTPWDKQLLAETGSLWAVKRITAVPGQRAPATHDPISSVLRREPLVPDGHIFVTGDSPTSADSHHWGYVPTDRVRAIVIATVHQRGQYRPPAHRLR
jgi:signal peptidase I